MLNVIRQFSLSRQNGLFINSCFAHCQTERQDTWFADDSPVLRNKVSLMHRLYLVFLSHSISLNSYNTSPQSYIHIYINYTYLWLKRIP